MPAIPTSILKKIRHTDQLLHYPDYLQSKVELILSRATVLTEDDCWVQKTNVDNKGRARIQIGYYSDRSARVVYVGTNMQPIRDLRVCHACDNPACVNPKHLWLGTQIQNIHDRCLKGRTARPIGTKNIKCKLSEEDVRCIKIALEQGTGGSELSRMYNVSPTAISYIKHGKSWGHV